MKIPFLSPFKGLLLFTMAWAIHLHSAEAQPSVRLPGHMPSKAIANAVLLHHLNEETHVPVTFVLPLRNQKELQTLIERTHNPSDALYGQYLTPQEFIERFAPSEEDYNQLLTYAQSIGLVVRNTHPNRLLLNVSGTSALLESAFNVRLHEYQLPSGRRFHAPDNEPEVPISIASTIGGIVGLDNHAKWRPFYRQKEGAESFLGENVSPKGFPSGPGGGFSPQDIVKAYNLGGLSSNGSGQSIALFELGGYQASDIQEYTSYFGLPSAKLTNVLVDGGSASGINPEVTLDIQVALALAPQCQIYVYEGPNSNQGVLDTYNRIATDNIAKQVSTSWGLGENLVSSQYLQAENAIFQQMAAQGQTIYAAAGDSGADDDYGNTGSTALVVDDPASQPYVVGVGGTRLTVNNTNCAYESETVWNNGLGNGAGGGGVSTVWPIPSWQTNISSCYSQTHRNVPDVALNADPDTGYAIYYNGQWTIFGGTSCAAPLWAAFTACVNQELAASSKPPLGFANPTLYGLARGSSYASDFHDVISGNNLFYNAHAGYDNASGWGSFNGVNLLNSLLNPVIVNAPILSISMSHISPFIKGAIGAYKIVVTNSGNSSTSGPVRVAVTLPTGLNYSSFSGSGWVLNNNTLTFTESDILPPGASYPTITLNVHVGANAPNSFSPTATVSGGGSASSTVANFTTAR